MLAGFAVYLVSYALGISVAHVACVRFGFVDLYFPRDIYRLLSIAGFMALLFGVGAPLAFPLGIPKGLLAMEILACLGAVKLAYRDFDKMELSIYLTIVVVLRYAFAFVLVLALVAIFGD